MADNRIQFSIGAVFNGEGFKKAQQAVSSMNRDIISSTRIVNDMANSFGIADKHMAGALKAVTGLMNGFLTLNPAMLAISAVSSVVSFAINETNKRMKEQEDRLEALRKKAVDVRKDFSADFIKNINGELAIVSRNFEAITKSANAFTAAMNALDVTQRKGGVLDLEVEKMKAAFEETEENAKRVSDAFYDVQIAERKLENATADAATANQNATKAVRDAESRVTANNEAQKKYTDAIEETKRLMETNYGDEKEYAALTKEYNALVKAKTELETQEKILRDNLRIAIVNESRIKEEGAQSVKLANAAVDKAYDAQNKLTEQIEKQEKAAKDKAEMDDELARRERELAEQKANDELAEKNRIEKAKEIQIKVNESAENLKKAQDEYAKALEAYNKNFTQNVIAEEFGKINGSKGTVPVKVTNAIQGRVADHAVDEAIRNRLVTTVKDADNLARQAAREARNQASRQFSQQSRERQRYERLQQQNRKTWSKADTDFVNKFEKIKAAAEKQKTELDQAKARFDEQKKIAEDAKKAAESMKDNSDKIRDSVKSLDKTMSDVQKLMNKLGLK